MTQSWVHPFTPGKLSGSILDVTEGQVGGAGQVGYHLWCQSASWRMIIVDAETMIVTWEGMTFLGWKA